MQHLKIMMPCVGALEHVNIFSGVEPKQIFLVGEIGFNYPDTGLIEQTIAITEFIDHPGSIRFKRMILAYVEIVETRRIYKDGIHEHTVLLRDVP